MNTQKVESKSVAKIEEVKAQPTKSAKVETMLMSQREAVFQEIQRVLKEDKVNFDGTTSVKPHLNEARLKKVYEGLVQGFRAKKIALKDNPANQKKLGDAALLHTYILGLVNNWLRRDPRLNGSTVKK